MINQSLLFIVLIVIAAFGLSFFQYYKAVFKKEKAAFLYLILRGLTYSIIGILLLNLSWDQKTTEVQPKELVLAVDNSASIHQLADTTQIKKWVNLFVEDEDLNEKFKITPFQFGEKINSLKNLNFQDQETNLAAVFLEIQQLVSKQELPMVLVSDGNPTFGRDVGLASQSSNFDVFPVVVGDTTAFADSRIDQIDMNSYAFLNNKFPIEAYVSYQGEEEFKTKLQLKENGKILQEKNIDFTANQASKRIQFEVLAESVGVKSYEVFLVPQEGEKQIENNSQEIALEVIDESTKILVLTSFLHPDLSALKKSIESNQQRKVEILHIQNYSGDLEGVNLLILYQPTRDFASVYQQLNQAELPHMVITGTKTDYRFLNNQQNDFKKENSNSTEEYFPSFNSDFSAYQQNDFYVHTFPPLEDKFGSVEIKRQADVLFHQQVQGIETDEPMLFFITQDKPKRAYWLGEQFWRWRAESYLQENKSFENFDNFMNKWVGFLSLNQKKSRLIVEAESFYKTQRNAKIKASLFDQNYELDKNSSLYIRFTNQDKQVNEFPMLFSNSHHEFNLDALEPGDYTYEVFSSKENLSQKGQFKLIAYSAEDQFVNANASLLKSIAKDETLWELNDFEKLKTYLLESQVYQPIQKEKIKLKPLIDWEILFIFLILSLSLEWFFRKYNGLI